ncbi:MAG: DUF1801 domain-containing protein [Anaeromyxobacteraceae bacterium]|nr:DUF1801 domain-containing protein [Anaeromyxobacteraceae bacterium]
MQSRASTPTAYVASLPPERRGVVQQLRATLAKHLPEGFEETMSYGMITWVVPHRTYPAGYHADPKQPLPFVSLASQKQYVALYHLGLQQPELLAWFEAAWPRHTAARLDLGKACLRLRDLDAVPYALVAELAERMTPRDWIEAYHRLVPAADQARPAARSKPARKPKAGASGASTRGKPRPPAKATPRARTRPAARR